MVNVIEVGDSYNIEDPAAGNCYVWEKGCVGMTHWKAYCYFNDQNNGKLLYSVGIGDEKQQAVEYAVKEMEFYFDLTKKVKE